MGSGQLHTRPNQWSSCMSPSAASTRFIYTSAAQEKGTMCAIVRLTECHVQCHTSHEGLQASCHARKMGLLPVAKCSYCPHSTASYMYVPDTPGFWRRHSVAKLEVEEQC